MFCQIVSEFDATAVFNQVDNPVSDSSLVFDFIIRDNQGVARATRHIFTYLSTAQVHQGVLINQERPSSPAPSGMRKPTLRDSDHPLVAPHLEKTGKLGLNQKLAMLFM